MSEHTGSTEDAPDRRRIVVGYSGAEGSEPALTWAIEHEDELVWNADGHNARFVFGIQRLQVGAP